MGEVLYTGRKDAPRAASGACMELLQAGLQETGLELKSATAFLADLGPGSFTGVRVGVTVAKTLAFAVGATAGGTDAFALISTNQTVVLPSKRGEWFVRRPDAEPERVAALPEEIFVGFGPGIDQPTYPDAASFGPLLSSIDLRVAELLVPRYLIEPSISLPKQAYTRVPLR